jgi:cysteine-rich repeat protein
VSTDLHFSAWNGLIVILAAIMGSCMDEPGEPCGNGYCPTDFYCWRGHPGQECVAEMCLKLGERLGICGNSIPEIDETCDDGNTNPGDGCSPSCRTERCGNDCSDHDEECDDGNLDSGDGCSKSCESEICGNGRVEPPNEKCDCGPVGVNGDCPWPPSEDGSVSTDICLANCKLQEELWIPPYDRRIRSEH